MKKYFTILTLVLSLLSNASIAQDSTASRASSNKKNSRFEEKLRENKEKRQTYFSEWQKNNYPNMLCFTSCYAIIHK